MNGIWQSLCLQEIGYHEHNKNYVGANIDAMVNLSSLFAGANPNRFFEVYGFVGPQLSVANLQMLFILTMATQVKELVFLHPVKQKLKLV